MSFAWCLALLLAVAGGETDRAARAMTLEGAWVEGTFRGLDADGRITLDRDGESASLPVDSLLVLHLSATEPPATAPATRLSARVHTRDGGGFHATLRGADQRYVELDTALVSPLRLPVASLDAICFQPDRRHAAAQAAMEKARSQRDVSEDVLIVLTEERVTVLRGVMESLAPGEAGFRWRNRTVPIDPERVYGLVFAEGVAEGGMAPAVCMLRDGDAWAGTLAGGDASGIELELATGERVRLPLHQIEGIRFHSKRLTFLSDLEPASYHFEPFGVTYWPWRRDVSVSNRPMRIGDREFERGIGMRSQARLVYELEESYSTFAAVIGIDSAVRPLGNTVFRVLADDEEVFNSGDVTGRDEAREILVPINGARRLELAVDFGEELDIADHANWGDARLIR